MNRRALFRIALATSVSLLCSACTGASSSRQQPAASAALPTHLQTDAPADFLPEGLAWDAPRERFLLGSVRLQRIDAIDARSGHASRFADAPGSVLGLRVDANTRTLWISWTRFGAGFTQNQGSGLAAYSLDDGRHLGSWPLPDTDPRRNLGELLLLDAHTIVASDSGTGAIHRFDTRSHRYATVVPAGQFESPQGIAPGRRASTILMADYASGLWHIDLGDGTRHALSAPQGAELRGIDGLYRIGDSPIGVQNGTRTHRVLRLVLDADEQIARVDKLAEGDPRWDEPSLGTVVGDRFWFNARSQWSRFDERLRPRADANLRAPLLDSVASTGPTKPRQP